MMNKIFFTIFVTIFLNHCGFSPIYVGNPKEVVVSKLEIIGDKNLDEAVINSIIRILI